MKKIILLILYTLIVLLTPNVFAQEIKFYEAEYIDNIWLKRITPDRKTIYYQKARFFRKTGTNEFAYCLEPFTPIDINANYEPIKPNNLTEEQIKRISLIAHFGYNYKNHTDIKWYAITQLMIWQIAEPNGEYFFTDKLNGNRIDIYQQERNEINYLIDNYEKIPSFTNQTFHKVLNEPITITDTNNILNEFTSNQEGITISNNTLHINHLNIGQNIIKLEKKDTYHHKPIIFYYASNSQNLVETGDIEPNTVKFYIDIQETKVNLNKIDSYTKSTTPSGDGILEGATYELYNQNMELIKLIEFDKTLNIQLTNLPYQKYYLKEIKAGAGYKIDEKTYEFELTKEQSKLNILLENKVIEATIKINKVYEYENQLLNEKNIIFEIYDSKENLYTSIITDELGNAEIKLPYGKYTIKQITTQPGYEFVEPFCISIEKEEDITINLINYKIKIPNTSITLKNFILKTIKKIIKALI